MLTSPIRRQSVALAALLVATLALPTAASLAQPAAEVPAAPAATPDKPDAAELARLVECRELAGSSKRLRGQLKNDLRYEMQQEDATFTMKNKKHVVIAYAALLILLVGFVVLLYLRQQTLLGEIARLARDTRAAAADDPGGPATREEE